MDVPVPITLTRWPRSKAGDIIHHSVASEIAAYRVRQAGNPPCVWLDLPQLKKMLEAGKARFGAPDIAVPEVSEDAVLRAAKEAFMDQIILMFVDGRQVRELDEVLELTPDSRVRYIKLTALRGC